MALEAKQIHTDSWIVYENEKPVGLFVPRMNYYVYLTETNEIEAQDLKDLSKKLGQKIKELKVNPNQIIPTNEVFIDGVPIRHKEYFDVEKTDFISYKSKINGNLRFAAGYWVIKQGNRHMTVLSPKVQTLLECEFLGPYNDYFTAYYQAKEKNFS